MRLLFFFLFFIISIFISVEGQVLRTEPLSDDIRTIQVNAEGNWQKMPVIELNSNNFIRVNFDLLGDKSTNLRYRLVYCNADWTQSSLADIEFVDGFNNPIIKDYALSLNTSVMYTNFIIDLPNDNVRMKIAGNYVVEVFNENSPSEILMRACFSVLDPQVLLGGKVQTVTNIDANKGHQQISFFVNYDNLSVRDVLNDLKIFVRQNNRFDNQKSSIKPTFIQGTKLVYEYNKDLIFEAGNEYRRFETVSYRYNGLNIEGTEYRRPYYQTYVKPDKVRADKVYVYDQDQNGRFVIRNAEASDSDIEADYFITNFRLVSPEPFVNPIYINGDFTNGIFDDRYLMVYDSNKGEYNVSVLLKQGAYNYQYLSQSGESYSPSLIEGNYYETENEYAIWVYYRPMGKQYDLLVGNLLIGTK